MAKILKNNTASIVDIDDTGLSVPASGQLTVNQTDYSILAASSDVIILLGDVTLTFNDGAIDLSISDGVDIIKDVTPRQVDTDTNGLVTVVDDSGVKRSPHHGQLSSGIGQGLPFGFALNWRTFE